MKRNNPEEVIHRGVVSQLRDRPAKDLVWWHTPNGGKRHIGAAKRFKALGVLPGVSDIVAVHRGKFYAMELKADGGRPTKAQLEFLARVRDAGGYGVVAEGLDQAICCLESWGLLAGRAAVRNQ